MENNKLQTSENPVLITWLTSPLETLQTMRVNTMQEAIAAKSPIMWHIASANYNNAKSLLIVMIADAVNFLNIGKNMNEVQILQTAELLLSDPQAKNMKPEDFKVMFNNGKRGDYGKQYDRLDGQVIFEWKNQYFADRMEYCENQNISTHGQKVKPANITDPKLLEMYAKLNELRAERENLKNPNVAAKITIAEDKPGYNVTWEQKEAEAAKKAANIVKSDRDVFIQKCLAEFDQLYKTDPVPGKGRFIRWVDEDLKEHIIDQMEYTQIKVKAYDYPNK